MTHAVRTTSGWQRLTAATAPLAGAVPVRRGRASAGELRDLASAVAAHSGHLAALWATDERDRGGAFALHILFAADAQLIWLEVPLAAGESYPDLADFFAPANRMQRAAADMIGVAAEEGDRRPWLRHAAWPAGVFPLRRDVNPAQRYEIGTDDYAFVPVAGDGVHEIPVGPVHAGIIEPGHFRFSIVGEKVLRLEERLGYKHKGISRRFQELALAEGARLAGRVSGDSTVAYAWAYAMAVESACDAEPPSRALWLRALALERERIANHLGDLGYLGNDGGFAFGLAQFLRLKEEVLRANANAFGHRYAMDFVVPGGVARDPAPAALAALAAQSASLAAEARLLKDIYDDHAGLQDRFLTCGRLEPELAVKLGVVGLAARASGQARDARVTPGFAPYPELGVKLATRDAGDVAARVAVRFEELFESLRLVSAIVARLPAGPVTVSVAPPAGTCWGAGRVEGWRGESVVCLELEHGRLRYCHTHDPSWQNWPALEHAVIGNIVPDFPLINKSFNLSYSGQDL